MSPEEGKELTARGGGGGEGRRGEVVEVEGKEEEKGGTGLVAVEYTNKEDKK